MIKNRAIILQSASIEKIQIAIGLLATTASMNSKACLFLQDEALVTLIRQKWANNHCSMMDKELSHKYIDAYSKNLMDHPYQLLQKTKEFKDFKIYGCSTTCKTYHLLDSSGELDSILGLSSFLSAARDCELQIL